MIFSSTIVLRRPAGAFEMNSGTYDEPLQLAIAGFPFAPSLDVSLVFHSSIFDRVRDLDLPLTFNALVNIVRHYLPQLRRLA
jgi:hypothetical protein